MVHTSRLWSGSRMDVPVGHSMSEPLMTALKKASYERRISLWPRCRSLKNWPSEKRGIASCQKTHRPFLWRPDFPTSLAFQRWRGTFLSPYRADDTAGTRPQTALLPSEYLNIGNALSQALYVGKEGGDKGHYGRT